VTDVLGGLNDIPGVETDVLALNGCTNYGGIAFVTVPSSSCSSGATGLGSGMVGLIESAARTSGIAPHPALGAVGPDDNVLSAIEVAQLLRATADDIDFSTPRPGEPANDQRGDNFERYPTTPGWDATFGFGRVNTFEAVRAVQQGEIPPEADLVGPSWFEVLPVGGTVDVRGAVGAVRSTSFGYRVEWTTGLQAPPYPGSDGTPDEDRFSVRIRVVVTDAEGRHAVAQRQVFVHDDPDLVEGSPERIAGVGTASPVFADVAAGGADELVVATDDGWVHVRNARGVDVEGWPRRTEPATWWPSSSPSAREFGIVAPHDRIGVGAPVVADLDADGSLDLVVADDGGAVTAWRADGTRRFRVVIEPDYSDQEATNDVNRLKRSFLASPAAGDLDGDGR